MEKAAAAAAATVMSCTGSNGELSCAEPPVFSPFFPPSCKVGTHLAPILAAGSPAAARFLPPPFSLFLSLPLFFPPPPLPFFFPPSPLSRPQRPPPQALRACRVRRGGGGRGGARAGGRRRAGGRAPGSACSTAPAVTCATVIKRGWLPEGPGCTRTRQAGKLASLEPRRGLAAMPGWQWAALQRQQRRCPAGSARELLMSSLLLPGELAAVILTPQLAVTLALGGGRPAGLARFPP